jgi:hypothetical protein
MRGRDGQQCSIIKVGSRSVVQQYAPISNAEAATGHSVVMMMMMMMMMDALDATIRGIASNHLLAGFILAGLLAVLPRFSDWDCSSLAQFGL